MSVCTEDRFDVSLEMEQGRVFDLSGDFLSEKEKSDKTNEGQKILAKIKRSSKYYCQTAPGVLFPIFIVPGGEYIVQGGPGGQYRLKDVNLFVVSGSTPVRIL